MRKNHILLIIGVLFFSSQACSWGQTGHRVVGAIAEYYLSESALAAIKQLLPNEDLAEVSTYADEMRSDSSEFWQKRATPWHYVNVHAGKQYEASNAPAEGDAMTALKHFSKQIKNPKTSVEDKRLALKFIVHIVGDLQQPFHSGTDLDEGGNKIKVIFFSEIINLHTLWDSALIDRQKLSYTEWTHRLQAKITDEQRQQWMVAEPQVWVDEAALIRQGLYPPANQELSWDYQYQNLPIIKQALQKGGLRLAAYLNALFADVSE